MKSIPFNLLPLVLLFLVANTASRAADPVQAARARNVVFLISDDQRADTIAALGNPIIKTPNLDKLVATGAAFTNARLMGGRHGALCVASRSMFLTGRTLARSLDQPPADVLMWPEVLRKDGYTTCAVGKWHNGPPTFARCFNAAHSVFFGGMSDQDHVPIQDFDPSGKYPAERSRIVNRYSSELFAESAADFIKNQPADKPFVLWAAFTTPHDPRTPHPDYAKLYDPSKMSLPKNFLPKHPFDNGEISGRDEDLLPRPRDPDAVKKEIAAYYAMITDLDARVGIILDALRNSPHARSTLIVFVGDNGLALGSHGLLGKQNLYEHTTRVPLILSGPGIPAGAKSDVLCYGFDLFPTLFESLGKEPPPGIDGQSLLPILRKEKTALREQGFFAYKTIQRAVIAGRYKLIRYTVEGNVRIQLFDLSADPDEMHDVSEDPAQAQTRKRLEAMLDRAEQP